MTLGLQGRPLFYWAKPPAWGRTFYNHKHINSSRRNISYKDTHAYLMQNNQVHEVKITEIKKKRVGKHFVGDFQEPTFNSGKDTRASLK